MILPRTLSTGHAWLSKRFGRSMNRHRESGASRHVLLVRSSQPTRASQSSLRAPGRHAEVNSAPGVARFGLIAEARHANEIVTGGDADLVLLARELLREPYWALKAQQELGAEASWPISYGYAVKRQAK